MHFNNCVRSKSCAYKAFLNFTMGRRKRMNKSQPKSQGAGDTRKPYEDIVRENDAFVEYYKKQCICKTEEWDQFLTSLKTDLPATFRITSSKGEAQKMLDLIQGQFLKDCLNQNNSEEASSIFPLPWYPNKLAWQMNLTRKDIRRNENYYKLHNFLISETENGTISRQETVSMIPPLLLDVQPHHKVLDMCAAPGSKTAQLLELLHAGDVPIPSGYVIANDADNKRCYMLVHQAKRLNSPCVAVINHDGSILPNLESTLPDGSTAKVEFDRILCDVPCSGDGTLRKNPDIWMKWTPASGLNKHGIQIRILRRGVELLAVGGRLVYSTCSLNPLENEAVIHKILSDTKGAVRLVDVGNVLPGLKYSPGKDYWSVGSRNLEFYESYDEVDKKWRTTIRPHMFPPKPEDRDKYQLHKCLRILPHQQNTGAFFVAVLEKIHPLKFDEIEKKDSDDVDKELCKSEDENEDTVNSKRKFDESLPQNQRKRRRKDCYREDPFIFFNEDEAVWSEIKHYYKISDEFDVKCLLTRCHTGKKKNVYMTSQNVRDLVIKNQNVIKFINTGVKTFVRSDNRNMKCAFRIANDALESIYDFIGEDRKVFIPKSDLITLLLNDDPQKSPPISTLSETVKKQVENLSPGSCVLVYKEEINGDTPLLLPISGWRGTTSLRCYMSSHSTVHLLRLLGGDISKYDVNKFKKIEEDEKDSDKQEGAASTVL